MKTVELKKTESHTDSVKIIPEQIFQFDWQALYTRFRSRQEHTFAEKVLSAMREKFGGHLEPKTKKVGEEMLMSGEIKTATKTGE